MSRRQKMLSSLVLLVFGFVVFQSQPVFAQRVQTISQSGNPYIPEPVRRKILARRRETKRLCDAAAKAMDRKDFARAEKLYRQAANVDRGSLAVWPALAEARDRQGKIAEAVTAYHTFLGPSIQKGSVLKAYPKPVMRYVVLLGLSDWPRAVRLYERTFGQVLHAPGQASLARRFDPNFPEPKRLEMMAHLGLALLWQRRGLSGLAAEQFREAAKIKTDRAVGLYYQGVGFQMQGCPDLAERAFRKAEALGRGPVKTAARAALR